GGEGQGQDGPGVAQEEGALLDVGGGDAPEAHGLVVAAGRQRLAVGGEGQGSHPLLVAGDQGPLLRLLAADVVQPRVVVVAAGGHGLVVRGEGDRLDGAGRRLDCEAQGRLVLLTQVPDLHGPAGAADGQGLVIAG